jgi:hypothetical protein
MILHGGSGCRRVTSLDRQKHSLVFVDHPLAFGLPSQIFAQ